MTGPVRTAPTASTPGEDAQDSEIAAAPLPWQGELDSAIADIDSRLRQPRRRVTDAAPPPAQAGQPDITSEVIDAIALRVAELLRNDGGAPATGTAVAHAISQAVAGPQAERRAPVRPSPPPPLPPLPPLPEPRALPHGIALTIRVRKPLFRFWPFRRRRRRSQAMIMFSDYRV